MIEALRVFARRLPAPVKRKLLVVYNALAPYSGPNRRRRKWVIKEYSVAGQRRRNDIFLTIAHFAHVNRPIEGYYFEFGCHGANTMRMAFDNFHYLFDWHYVAFNSFEGLPEIAAIDRQKIWAKGRLRTSEDAFRETCVSHGMPSQSLTTVKGFYDDVLNEKTRERFADKKAAVIYVDCDLYKSAVPVLAFCRDFLQPGTVIVFDDWNCFCADPNRGERLAWTEFRRQNPDLNFESFVNNGMQAAFVFTGSKVTSGFPAA